MCFIFLFSPFISLSLSLVCSELHFVYSGCACVKHLSCFCSLGSPAAELLSSLQDLCFPALVWSGSKPKRPKFPTGLMGNQPNTDHIRLQKDHTVSHLHTFGTSLKNHQFCTDNVTFTRAEMHLIISVSINNCTLKRCFVHTVVWHQN